MACRQSIERADTIGVRFVSAYDAPEQRLCFPFLPRDLRAIWTVRERQRVRSGGPKHTSGRAPRDSCFDLISWQDRNDTYRNAPMWIHSSPFVTMGLAICLLVGRIPMEIVGIWAKASREGES